jgi:hypothetical protein
MLSPSDKLKTITNITYDPAPVGRTDLTVNNFSNLMDLFPLDPGTEVEIEGYIIHVSSKIDSADKDVHFCLAPVQDSQSPFVICEIQNAIKEHKDQLDLAQSHGSTVRAKGPLRIFLEHISATTPFTNHLFEIHPARSVSIDGQVMDNVTMDCPDGQDYTKNDSMYEFKMLSNSLFQFKKLTSDKWPNPVDESVVANYDDVSGSMIFTNIPKSYGKAGVEHNYVYMKGYFSKLNNASFSDGKPYYFAMQSPDDPSIVIKSVAIPDTPAYNDVKNFDNSPPDTILTAVALRSLNIPKLMTSNYETILSPVYRFDQNV